MLAMFSIMGAFRTAPELIHVLRNYGLFHSVCVPRWVILRSITWLLIEQNCETFSLDKKLFRLTHERGEKPAYRLFLVELCSDLYYSLMYYATHVLIDSNDDKKFGFAMNYSFSSELVRWILIWHSNVIAFELNFQLDHRQVLKISFRHPMSVGSESKTFFNTKSPLNHFSRDG